MVETPLDLLTVDRVAELLAVSKSEVYALCQADRLKHFRIGMGRGTIRICRQDLYEFLQRCRVTSTKRPAVPTKEQQAETVIRPFKHIVLNGAPAVPPDGDDRAADTNVNSER